MTEKEMILVLNYRVWGHFLKQHYYDIIFLMLNSIKTIYEYMLSPGADNSAGNTWGEVGSR